MFISIAMFCEQAVRILAPIILHILNFEINLHIFYQPPVAVTTSQSLATVWNLHLLTVLGFQHLILSHPLL